MGELRILHLLEYTHSSLKKLWGKLDLQFVNESFEFFYQIFHLKTCVQWVGCIHLHHDNQNGYAKVAQLVEHDLAKVEVASSNLVFRSKSNHR